MRRPRLVLTAAAGQARIMAVIDEVSRNRGIGVPRRDGQILHDLVLETKARHAVEIGTYRGHSGLWIAMALRRTGGRLTTYDIDPEVVKTARANYRRAGVDDLIAVVVGDAHQEILKLQGPIDFVFIDADKDGYHDYLTKLTPKVRIGGVIVAHNVSPFMPDRAFYRAITTDPRYETRFTSGQGGMSISRRVK